MRTRYVVEGKPDCQVLEEFFDGTIPTPAEREARAIKIADEVKSQLRKQQRTSRKRRSGE